MFHLLPPPKGEIGGLTFFIFFSIVENFGNTQMIAAWYKTLEGLYQLCSPKLCAAHNAQSGPLSGAKNLCAIVALP
jgi:hypothetical protein